MKTCAGCSACCETIPVMEIGLAPFTPCTYQATVLDVSGPGCKIYATRPGSCRSWSCLWLKSNLPDELKPSRSGLVINPTPDLIRVNDKRVPAREVWVMAGHENDWETNDQVWHLIVSLLHYDECAVLWRMRDGTAIGFWRDPKTGEIGRSQPTQAVPDDEHDLGSNQERVFEAELMLRHRSQHRGGRR